MTRPKGGWRQAYSRQRAATYRQLLRVGLGPLYNYVLQMIAESASLSRHNFRLRILDLGAGTGNVARHLSKLFPACSVVCLDGSADMLSVARKRMKRFPRTRFVERDFSLPDWTTGLGRYDVVVSVGAIHHLDDSGKQKLFGQILGILRHKGVFICGDPLRGDSPALDRRYEDCWVRLIKHNLQSLKGMNIPLQRIRHEHRLIQRAEGDQPSTLRAQLTWLKEAGFQHVDCHWKHFGFAVFGGMRRS